MARQLPLHERIAERRAFINLLITDFGRFVDAYDENRQFSGPSLYFHAKTIATLRSHPSPGEALTDSAYFDYLYATLASWGLHRMGPGNAKLVEIDELKGSFLAQRQKFEHLQGLRIESLDAGDVGEVASMVWDALRDLRVGVGQTLLVANSTMEQRYQAAVGPSIRPEERRLLAPP